MAVIDGNEAGLKVPSPTQVQSAPSSPVRRLARASAGSFGLSVLQTAVTTLTTIVLARIMGVSDYGTYAFVVATVTLLGVPSILGVDRLLIRDLAVHVGENAYGLARGLLARATQQTLVVSLAIAAIAALGAWLVNGQGVTPGLVAFWAGCVALPFLALGRVAQGGLMGLHHVVLGQVPDLLFRPLLLFGLVAVAYLSLGPSLGAPLVVGLHALSVMLACAMAYVLLSSRRPPGMRVDPAVHRTSAWFAASVSLALLSSTAIINTQTGVVLLGALGGPESAGIYSVAQRGALLVAFPLAAVNTAIAPMAARLWASGERQRLQHLVTLSARGVLLSSLPIAIIFCVFGRQIVTLLFGAEFADADVPLAILTIGQIANAATGSVAVLLVMTGHQRRATVSLAIATGLNITVALVLIPGHQAVGAAIAAATSLVVSNLLMVAATRRSLGVDPTAVGWIKPKAAAAP